MFCRHCGNQLADDAKFCNKCGGSVARESAEPAAPAIPTPVIFPEQPMTPPPAAESELPFEPAVPYTPEKPAKKGLPWWAILLIVLGGLIVAIAAFVLVDGLANEGKLTESVIGVNLFASAEDAEDDEDSDKENSDKDKDEDGEEADDTEDKDADKDKDKDEDKNNSDTSSSTQLQPDLDKVSLTNLTFEWHKKDLCLDFDIVNDSGADLSVEKIFFQLLTPDGKKVVATHTKEYYGMTLAKDTTLYQFIFFAEANIDRSIQGFSEDDLNDYVVSYEIYFE